jgi:hypothetical protein
MCSQIFFQVTLTRKYFVSGLFNLGGHGARTSPWRACEQGLGELTDGLEHVWGEPWFFRAGMGAGPGRQR